MTSRPRDIEAEGLTPRIIPSIHAWCDNSYPLQNWIRIGETLKERSNSLSNLTRKFISYFLYTRKRKEEFIYKILPRQYLILVMGMRSVFSLFYPDWPSSNWRRERIINVFWQYPSPLRRSHPLLNKSKGRFLLGKKLYLLWPPTKKTLFLVSFYLMPAAL